MKGISLVEAAKHFNVHPYTVRRWIVKEGCPCESLGTVGRGKGSLVDPEEVQRWRAEKYGAVTVQRETAEVLAIIATALIDTLKRDQAHERVDIHQGQASGLLALAYQRIWQNLTRRPLDEFVPPPEIKHLCAIFVQWRERQTGG